MPEPPHARGLDAALRKALASTSSVPGRVLRALTAGPSSPSAIAPLVGATVENVAWHVRELESAGLLAFVRIDSQGKERRRIYRLADDVAEAIAWHTLAAPGSEPEPVALRRVASSLVVTPAGQEELGAAVDRLTAEVDVIAERHGAEDGVSIHLFVALVLPPAEPPAS